MNNTLEGINSRITEGRVTDKWPGRQNGRSQSCKTEYRKKNEKKKKRMKTTEDSLTDLWDNIKHTNMCIIWVSDGEEREKGPGKHLKR